MASQDVLLPGELIDRLVASRLRRADIRRTLAELEASDHETYSSQLSEVLRHTLALLEVSRRVGDALSLDLVLPRLVELVSEFLDAERCTLFLHDTQSDELYTKVGVGLLQEIRIGADEGIAGAVFRSGEPVMIHDPYSDPRFNPEVDRRTGFRTRDIMCAPIWHEREGDRHAIGVSQVLNKRQGSFDPEDLSLLQTLTSQAAAALVNARLHQEVTRARAEQGMLLEVTAALSSELQLHPLLRKIMDAVCDILDAERATLFLHDPKTKELWARLYRDAGSPEVRFPSHLGIAGSVFTSGQTINIPDAYADPRFNPAVDKKTNYRTRNILCMPVYNRKAETIAVTQVLNKRGGRFTAVDEGRLRAFSAQAAIAMENAQLFDEVIQVKNYNESILESMSAGVVTLDAEGAMAKANAAAARLLRLDSGDDLAGRAAHEVFVGANAWVDESIERVRRERKPAVEMDADLYVPLLVDEPDTGVSVNLTAVPLGDPADPQGGCLLMIEDLTNEKRLKSTMARYMTKELADKLLEEGESALGGKLQNATVLFTDIRGFTSISERIGPQETVRLLNEYFSLMVDVILERGGILDKYIGDAIMAVFGAPFENPEDADHAVQAAVGMLRALEAFNARRGDEGQDPVLMGIGVNTDAVLSGNIGSLKRMDYTVIGDGVNLASRLEGANKLYGTQILVSEFTRRDLKGSYRIREVDRIRVKGKDKPVGMFEVLDHVTGEAESRLSERIGLFGEALGLYRRRDWTSAREKFEAVLALGPDGPSRLYVKRCGVFLETPPPDDWDGVWVMTDK